MFSRFEKRTVEGKICAELHELRHLFRRAVVGMKQETAYGTLGDAEEIVERSGGVEAVNRRGEIPFGGERELREENFRLLFHGRAFSASESRVVGFRTIEHPAIESDLAHASVRIGIESGAQGVEPGGRKSTRLN